MTVTQLGYTPRMGTDEVWPISNSEIQTWKDCKRKWFLGSYLGLRLKLRTMTGPLALGSRIHSALEAYYTEGADLLQAHAKLLDADRQAALMDLRDVTELENEGELGRIMLEGYMEWLEETGADSGWEIVSAERVVSAPIVEGRVELRGKLDMRVRRLADDVLLFVDHKALHVDQQVLTPSGYRRIGDVSVSDEVIAPDGSTTRITGVYPQGVVPLNCVTFSDHTSVLACDDHLWKVRAGAGKWNVLDTKTLVERGVKKDYGYQKYNTWSIPTVEPMKLDLGPSPQILDPYILGVVLGDGLPGGVRFCSWDDEIPAEVERRLTPDQRIHTDTGGHGFSVTQTRVADTTSGDAYKRSPLLGWYRQIGLEGTRAHEKFVPDEYKYAPAADRLDLLRGLMDTDGYVKPVGKQVGLVSTSEQLRDDVAWLVRSLGGLATCSGGKAGSYKDVNGDKVACRPVYVVSIQLPDDVCPFLLPRKVEAFHSVARRTPKRKIVSIESAGEGEAVCISVAHPDRLYVTDGFTVTHNTTANFADLTRTAYMDEQFLTYHLLETLSPTEDGSRCDGGVYNMLKKVKRTGNARPPFYDRCEVHHNKQMLHSFWYRIHGEVMEMLELKRLLDAGADHRQVAYPRPSRDCSWKCPFFAVCPLIDDGSAAEHMLNDLYEVADPNERYSEDAKRLELATA